MIKQRPVDVLVEKTVMLRDLSQTRFAQVQWPAGTIAS